MAAPYLCAGEHGEIIVGTLFAWQPANNAPRVARYRADHGQLLWAALGTKPAERAFAVLVGGRQVRVQSVTEALGEKPARLVVEFIPADAPPGAGSASAEIALPALLESVFEGLESIEATRAGT